ncbi:hypothetical protein MKX01_003098 [Papaver californicum]|nr:hypothetical protein MKX01_003098 [Papaver californicum]
MVNWFRVDVVMSPTDSFDINGCWPGSATILPGNKPNIAVPKDLSDPLLVEWKKLDQNPDISTPDDITPDKFRDPTTGWLGEDGYWRILIGSEKSNKVAALLFKSNDFMTWTESENAFHSAEPDTSMWECLDFFPVSLKGKEALDTSAGGDDIKYVFKVGIQDTFTDFYTVGNYFVNNGDPYSPVTDLRLDYGKFYASKAFFDEAKNRRILWAWVNEPDSPADVIARGWAGIQLSGEKGATIKGGIGPFGLLTLASKDLEEYTAVFFRVFRAQDNMSSLREGGLPKSSYGAFMDVDLIDGEISLRCLVKMGNFSKMLGKNLYHISYIQLLELDHSVVESFDAGGITCISTIHLSLILHYHRFETGPMYYNGIYHLFYQYNPNGAEWGDVVWAHSVSKDMVNWFRVDIALHPTDPFDKKGCWSGSVTILPGKGPVIFYTGGDTENGQVQNITVPKDLSDPLLVEWKKLDQNPVISTPDGINPDKFPDPSTGWLGEDGYWRVLIGSEKSRRGMALLFKSNDFMTWTESENAFHSAEPDTGMWECLDFFPVSLNGKEASDTSAGGDDIKYVFKVGIQDTFTDFYTYYIPDNTVGDPYSPVTDLRLDYGKFYASKAFFDEAKNRRILWAWVNEPDSPADVIARGWAGIQELATLRTDEVGCTNEPLTTRRPLFEADIEVTFRIPSLENAELFDPSWVDAQQLSGEKGVTVNGGIGPFGLLTLASKDLEEYTAAFFRVFRAQDKYVVLMCSGGSRSSLREGLHKPSYGAFVDVDLIDGEISILYFGAGGKACITTRTYPTLAVGKKPIYMHSTTEQRLLRLHN